MKATISPSSGYCILDNSYGTPELYSAVEMQKLDPIKSRHALGFINDWQVKEFDDTKQALLETKELATIARCISLIKLRLKLYQQDDHSWMFVELEQTLLSSKIREHVLRLLLVAPMKNAQSIFITAEKALTDGFGVTAELLNRLHNLQPLLMRFSKVWLDLPEDPFIKIGDSKQTVWCNLVDDGIISKCLEASNISELNKIFGFLAFNKTAPFERSALASIGHQLGNQIYDTSSNTLPNSKKTRAHAPNNIKTQTKTSIIDWQSEKNRAIAEINAIETALSIGDDYKAGRFLDELLNRQISSDDTNEHAVKSLCNLAKKCADMFRTDFEYLCLVRAIELDSTDSWTQIQLGDYYKRAGVYDKASEILDKAKSSEYKNIVQSLLADIEAQKGNYEESIKQYKNIPNWESEATTRTAIADNLRRLGRFSEALDEYNQIEKDGLDSFRTIAGKAEIAKKEGYLKKSIGLYKLLINKTKNHKDGTVYRISCAGLLVQTGKYNDALIMIEDVIAASPFSMRARVIRASIIGLMGNASEGLKDLPDESSSLSHTAFGEWISAYTRGLLLLRTDKFHDAQKSLMRCLDENVLDREGKITLRLAAALSFLTANKPYDANQIIRSINKEAINPEHIYFLEVFELHMLIVKKDFVRATTLFETMKPGTNVLLFQAASELHKGNISQAVDLEIEYMLRLVA